MLGLEVEVGGPLERVHLGVSGFLAHGGEATEDLLEGAATEGHATFGEGEFLLDELLGLDLRLQGADGFVGHFLDLHGLGADVDEREGAGAFDADGREVDVGR